MFLEMTSTNLNGGSRNWPILGDSDDDWASFAYLWPNYVIIDHKNIDNGTGNADAKENEDAQGKPAWYLGVGDAEQRASTRDY